jgi:uncharacterized cupin superfamily protein
MSDDRMYIVNARDAEWRRAEGRGAAVGLTDDAPQVGVNLFVLGPGEPMAMYHWEADQEDFLVVSGEAIAIVDGEERPLRTWDLLHTPPGVAKVVIGAGSDGCIVVAIGARAHQDGDGWGGYLVDDRALAHGAGVTEETNDPMVAYSTVPHRKPVAYADWLE